MAQQPLLELDQAYRAAATFIDALATLAWHSRRYHRDLSKPDGWKGLGGTYAQAFIAWFDLSYLLTPAVRDAARRAYPVGAVSIKVGKLKAKATVIEAMGDELGVYFRNVLYQDRRHPLDPDHERVMAEAKAKAVARQVSEGKPAEPFGWGADFDELMKKETPAAVRERLGIKTLGDAWLLMAREWESQGRARAESRLEMLRCGSIDFDDLLTQLDREARAVLHPERRREPSKRRGRRSRFDSAKDAALVERWNRARTAKISKQDFCKDEPMDVTELEKAQKRVRERARKRQ